MSPTARSTPPAPAQSSEPQRSSARPRRNYQACLPCKEQKVRCQLGSPDDPQPPCARCRRSRLDCVFGPPRGAVRGSRRKRRRGDWESCLGPQGDPVPTDVPSVGVHAPSSGGAAVPVAVRGDRPVPGQLGHQPNTENPVNSGTASSTASHRPQAIPWDASAIESELRSRDLSDWGGFQLCRDGWISPNEAEFLLQCYFEWMEPLYPVVDESYRDPARRATLIADEPVLCTAILTVASRYAWFEGTPASSRAHEIHSLLFKQAQQSIHQSLWGIENDAALESRILCTIESIVLFVEWRPRPMDIMPNKGMVAGAANMFGVESGDPPTGQTSVIDDETRKAYMLTRRLNATSWRLLGHAVNLGDEISLVEGLSKTREAQPRPYSNARRRARIRDLLIPLTWEISFRLGRSSFLKLPSPSSTTVDEYSGDSVFSPLLSSRAELYRLCRLIENTLYASVSSTKDIIVSDRHPEMVSSLAEIMTDWWNKFQRISGPFALRKTIEIQYHNVWTYLHAVAFQAVIERLRGFSSREPSIEHFERTYRPQGLSIVEILRSERSRRDLQLAEEIAKAGVHVLELSLDLDREGYLRFIPFTTMTWILTSATLLLKGTGLRAVVDLGTTDLLKRISRALDRAVVDDVHALSHYSASLLFLTQKVQTGAATSRTGRPQNNTDQGAAADASQPVPAAANLPPMNAENPADTDGSVPEQGTYGAAGGLLDPMFSDNLAEDWANWLSVGFDNMDGSFGFDLYSGFGAADFAPPDML
ncbi:C6 transcription factor [Neofusicoccum parvum]|uniref:C6 transcription factor n=1 Tax=Neofusicoccum parvum TaxID=310453 RepID=A0ACB5SM07_9PEZI|nr:C6 transcription factor [Neofusicoccum parvum]